MFNKLVAWVRLCTAHLEEIAPPLSAIIVKMRSELGLPLDEENYKAKIIAVIRRALEKNERFFQEQSDAFQAKIDLEQGDRI